MKLIVISTPDKKLENEAEIVSQLFENGLHYFHLRKNGYSKKYLENYILKIPERYRSNIIIHSHYRLALKYKLKGIHFNRKNRRRNWRKKLLAWYFKFAKPDLQISTSFHNIANLYEDDFNYNYVFLSPVFDSISKSGFQSAFSKNNLAQVITKSKHRIVAFGGVDIDKMESCHEMKFDGVVLSGCIWKSDQPEEKFISIKNKLFSMNALD